MPLFFTFFSLLCEVSYLHREVETVTGLLGIAIGTASPMVFVCYLTVVCVILDAKSTEEYGNLSSA